MIEPPGAAAQLQILSVGLGWDFSRAPLAGTPQPHQSAAGRAAAFWGSRAPLLSLPSFPLLPLITLIADWGKKKKSILKFACKAELLPSTLTCGWDERQGGILRAVGMGQGMGHPPGGSKTSLLGLLWSDECNTTQSCLQKIPSPLIP